MTNAPELTLRNVSTKDGNLNNLYRTIGFLMPKGRVVVMAIAHDDDCPCMTLGAGMPECTCDEVDVTLSSKRNGI